jgi:alkanesulfonate monooxygenase SsuD/methylene tetrahydromethanopterin reductase-like flavin-dependent oxidoreductase (luciferase family)
LPFDQLREVAREAEALGFESLWTPAGGVPDAFQVCTAWTLDTGLPTGISVVGAPRMWTPLALATQAASLAVISGGKHILGLGTGGYGPAFWASFGLPNKPIASMRAYVTATRDLLRGDSVELAGPMVTMPPATLAVKDLPPAPIHLAALGPQMLRLAGEVSDGALLNWASPERILESRRLVAEGAAKAGRDPSEVAMTMYIRVCVDEDVAAARRALGAQVLGYAMGRPNTPPVGYRGLFAEMGFDAVLSELERKREEGATMAALVDAAPDELLNAVGYFGTAADAPAAYARLTPGLDETVVRIVTARPGPEPVVEALAALTPAKIRAALNS